MRDGRSAAPAGTKAIPATARSPLVFVVNNSPDLLALLRDLFEDEGYAVRTRIDRADATFREIRSAAPALLVIDLALTDPDIWPLVARLEGDATTRAIPQLYTSTMGTLLDRAKVYCTAPDRQRFLAKPYDLDAVLAAARALLGPVGGAAQGPAARS